MANPDVWKQRQNNLNLYRQTSGGGDRLDCVFKRCSEAHISSSALPLVTVLQKTFHLQLIRISVWLTAVGVACVSVDAPGSATQKCKLQRWCEVMVLRVSPFVLPHPQRSGHKVTSGLVRLSCCPRTCERHFCPSRTPAVLHRCLPAPHIQHTVLWIADPCYFEPAFMLICSHVSAEALKWSTLKW